MVAENGSGQHSPFTEDSLAHIEELGAAESIIRPMIESPLKGAPASMVGE